MAARIEEISSVSIALRLVDAVRERNAKIEEIDVRIDPTPYRRWRSGPRPPNRYTDVTLKISAVNDWLGDPYAPYDQPDPGGLMREIEQSSLVLFNYQSATFEFAERMMLFWGAEALRIQKEQKR